MTNADNIVLISLDCFAEFLQVKFLELQQAFA